MKNPLFIGIVGSALALGGSVANAQNSAPKDKSPRIQLKQQQSGPFHFQMNMQSRGRLGARVISISNDLRAYFGAQPDQGLLVDSVVLDSPADKAGLRAGDMILEVEGAPIDEVWDIHKVLSDKNKGDLVSVRVLRDKKMKTLKMTLDSSGVPSDAKAFRFNFDSDNGFRGFGPDFPFGSMGGGFDSPADMAEQLQRLEERLRRLEGRSGKGSKAPPAKKKGGKRKLKRGSQSGSKSL
jgi:hypothetical protein